MAQQTINVGAAPNDGTGTPLRTAFQYTNSNFTELYTALGGGSGLPGASGQLIFNNGTSLAGDNELFYNATTNTLTTEKLIVPGNTQVAGSASNLYVGSILNPTLFANTNTKLVGIGTASPSTILHLQDASTLYQTIQTASGGAGTVYKRTGSTGATDWLVGHGAASASNKFEIYNSGSSDFEITSNGQLRYAISTTGVHTWQYVGGVAGTAMTLNSTGLGVGGAPVNPLTVFAAASAKAPALLLSTAGSPTYGWDFSVDGAVNGNLFIRSLIGGTKTDVLEFDRATGNVGIGVTPAAKFDSLVADAAESARFRAASGWLRIHPYVDATDVCRIQSTNNTNTGLQTLTLEGINLRFNTNSGNAVIIDNLGNTVSNVNSAVPALGTNNRMVFNLTSNTNLRISVRGSDGVTRVANITLA